MYYQYMYCKLNYWKEQFSLETNYLSIVKSTPKYRGNLFLYSSYLDIFNRVFNLSGHKSCHPLFCVFKLSGLIMSPLRTKGDILF